MIEQLLSDSVRAAETFGDDPKAYLLPEEEQLVARAVEKRRREVTNARSCARRALRDLLGAGYVETAIPRGDKGQPLWPGGVVGSMTHTKGYCAAVVADSGEVRSVGIDAEEHGPLPDGVLDHIAIGAELTALAALPQPTGTALGSTGVGPVRWDRLLFSAKESVYKVWFPLTQRWLGFEDAAVTLEPTEAGNGVARGTFSAKILIDGTTLDDGPPLTHLSGTFLARPDLVATAITLLP